MRAPRADPCDLAWRAAALARHRDGASIVLLAPDLLVAAHWPRSHAHRAAPTFGTPPRRFVEAQPWLGYGYYAFWLPENGPAYWVREAVDWQVASAHSGWLELALGMGRIGVVLFALQLLATLPARRARDVGCARRPVGAGVSRGFRALHVERKPRAAGQQPVLDHLRGGRGPTRIGCRERKQA